MFEKKGLFVIAADKADEDKLMEIALEAGADDVRRSGDNFEVLCAPEAYDAVSKALAAAGIQPDVSEISRLPKNTVDVSDPEVARKILKLMNRLDDHDDVQNVSSNFNIPEAVMAQVGEE
jgi:transcriptional/translational regulatory protein YebC/TACO1